METLAGRLLIPATILSALAVAGCSSALVQRDVPVYATSATPAYWRTELHIHRPRALLARQPAPDCQFKGSDTDGLDTDLWERLKLDYERHCYQQRRDDRTHPPATIADIGSVPN